MIFKFCINIQEVWNELCNLEIPQDKGQLISEVLFGVFNSTKKRTINGNKSTWGIIGHFFFELI